jgi:hypothetical protein
MDFKALYDRGRRSKIRHAIDAGDLSMLKKAGIAEPEGIARAEPDLVERHKQSLRLVFAVSNDNLADAQDALLKGAFVDFRDPVGVTIFSKSPPGTEAYARIELGRPCGTTPLMIAAKKGNHAMMLLLINAGANVNADTNYGSCPFPNVLKFAADEATAELLRRHGARG